MTDSTENDRRVMFKEAVRNVEYCAELVVKQLQGEDMNSQLNELKTVMRDYCDLDNNWKLEKQILGNIESSLSKEHNMNKIDEMYTKLRGRQSDEDPTKHEWYLGLERKIQQWMDATGDGDCNIVAGESTQSVVDPFTKRQLSDPVRNKLCGHSYERVTILTILQRKKEIRCPVVGCAQKGLFNESHLEDDEEMVRHLQRLEEGQR